MSGNMVGGPYTYGSEPSPPRPAPHRVDGVMGKHSRSEESTVGAGYNVRGYGWQWSGDQLFQGGSIYAQAHEEKSQSFEERGRLTFKVV